MATLSPDPDWTSVVARHARAAGVELSSQTIDELATHLEDIYLAARARLGRGIRLADLLANGWKEVVEIQPRKVWERLAACRSGCACGEGEGKNQQDRDRHATL